MLLIDEHGEKLGVMPTGRALQIAQERELDLALMSALSRPPVAKILDYGKYQYLAGKNARSQTKSSKAGEVKGIRLGLRISAHDLDTQLVKTRKFLEKGYKVKYTMRFRGRETAHLDLAYDKMRHVADLLVEDAKVEAPPQRAGMQMHMLIAPKPKSSKKPTV